jgi:hypothetical protein
LIIGKSVRCIRAIAIKTVFIKTETGDDLAQCELVGKEVERY